jgi:hypothetical protein
MSDYLKPKSTGIRQPLTNTQMNGRIFNPPRMAALGGLSSPKKKGAMMQNTLKIRRPGDTV